MLRISFREIRLSKNVDGFINNSANISPDELQYAHAFYIPADNTWNLVLIAGDVSGTLTKTEYGSVEDVAGVTRDHDVVVTVDLDGIRNEKGDSEPRMFIKTGFPVVSSFASSSKFSTLTSFSSADASLGGQVNLVFGSDKWGYAVKLMTRDSYVHGTNLSQTTFVLTAYSASDPSVTVAETLFGTSNDPNGVAGSEQAHLLISVHLIDENGKPFDRAVSNITPNAGTTSSKLFLDVAFPGLARTPQAGDIICVGSMLCTWAFEEDRFRDPSSLESVNFNFRYDGSDLPLLQIRLLEPAAGQNFADITVLSKTQFVDETAIRRNRDTQVVPNSAIARLMSVAWEALPAGRMSMGPIEEEILVSARDARLFRND